MFPFWYRSRCVISSANTSALTGFCSTLHPLCLAAWPWGVGVCDSAHPPSLSFLPRPFTLNLSSGPLCCSLWASATLHGHTSFLPYRVREVSPSVGIPPFPQTLEHAGSLCSHRAARWEWLSGFTSEWTTMSVITPFIPGFAISCLKFERQVNQNNYSNSKQMSSSKPPLVPSPPLLLRSAMVTKALVSSILKSFRIRVFPSNCST